MEALSFEARVMKILLVVHGFPPVAEAGAELYAHAHAKALCREYGDDILVLTREQDPSRAEYAVRHEHRDGVRIAWINNTFRKTRAFEETYRNEAIEGVASRVIDEFQPDVAHIHHLTGLSTTIVSALAARGIPRLMTLHDYWMICHRGQLLDVNCHVCAGPELTPCESCLGTAGRAGPVSFFAARALRELERRLPVVPARTLRRAAEQVGTLLHGVTGTTGESPKRLEHMREMCARMTHFLAPSHHVRNRFVQFGIPADRITVHQLGLDRAALPVQKRTRGDRLRVGFLGSVMVSKGPHVLLEAVRQLPAGTVSVDLFGGHAAYHGDDGYRNRIERLSEGQDVRAHGPIPHDRVAQALSAIDVLVVPSIWPETSSIVTQEAFLAGVPVVAARIGAIPEFVDDGRNGLLFEAGDSNDLARVLKRLITEPHLVDVLRDGRPDVKTIEDDVRATRRMYEAHAIGGRSPRRARVSAVVLNFRTPDDTLLAVKSLRASSRPLDDIIVVDNDPRDALRDALQSMSPSPSITYLASMGNLGFSGGMNAGIREALKRGADRVLLVNSDVIVPPDCVERLERALDKNRAVGIAAPMSSIADPIRIWSIVRHRCTRARPGACANRPAAAAERPTADDDRIVDAVSGCVMMVNRAVFETIGLFDPDYFFSFEDLDFCLKARAAGFATVLGGDAVVYHEGAIRSVQNRPGACILRPEGTCFWRGGSIPRRIP